MSHVFPFDHDSATLFYLSLYMVTLVIHVFFMSYVLAGSLYLAWANMFAGTNEIPRVQQPLACLLREWMPFVLSAAITVGVAPLLFVQIIYKQQFYTANLLLGWRWMIVIPVLTAAFYLLYVVKSKTVEKWSIAGRTMLGLSTAVCFLFIAFCWSANHLLSIDRTIWAEAYSKSSFITSRGDLCLRLATWIAGTFPVMSVLAGWQLVFLQKAKCATSSNCDTEAQRLAIASVSGLLVACITGSVYITRLPGTVTDSLLGSPGVLWIGVLGVGVAMQVAGWLLQWRKASLSSRLTGTVTAGMLAMLTGTVILRELIRATQAGLALNSDQMTDARQIGGFGVFMVFAVINTGLIVWCVRLVHRRSQPK